nr:hypothetical protein [Tanacetum cinerariifolium]
MSSDNTQSIATYTSISFDSNGTSLGFQLMNTGELPEMDPYEEVAQQGHVPPLSPAYVPNPMELDEYPLADDAPPTAESPGCIADLYLMGEYTDEDSIDYLYETKDGEEDDDEVLEEDPSEEHEPEDDDEDPEEDLNAEHELEDEDTKKEEPSEGSDETKQFKENEIAGTPPPRHHGARISIRPQTPMAASTQALINAFATGSPPFPLPPTIPVYDQAPLGHREAMIRMRDEIPKEDMPPRRRFMLTAPLPGCDVAESSTAARAPRAEDVGYVRALHAFEHRMMTSIEEVNLRISYQAQVYRQESKHFYTQLYDAQTDRRDIILKIDVHQSVEDLAVTQMMRIHTLETIARTDMVEDTNNSCAALTWWNGHVSTLGHDAAYAMTWGILKKKLTDKYHPKGKIKKLEIELWNLRVRGNDVAAYTQCFQELFLMCTKFLVDEAEKVNKYISRLPDNIHGNVMSARPKTLDAIEFVGNKMIRVFLLLEMDPYNHPTLISTKHQILDTGKFEQWKFKIQQYLQHEHYALWEVIEFGDSYKAPLKETGKDKGLAGEVSSLTNKKGRTLAITAEDM